MMTLCNYGITPNRILNSGFHRITHLVTDVTIGHTNSMQHDFKPNTSSMENVENTKEFTSNDFSFCPHKLFRKMWTRINAHALIHKLHISIYCDPYQCTPS